MPIEEQLRQSQKMEALGTLAGRIAHDFNNILTAMNGYITLARRQTAGGSPSRKHLDEVLKSTDRAKGLIQQILAFSRKTEDERELVCVADILDEVLKFLRVSIPSTIEISTNVDPKCQAGPNCEMVFALPAQLFQLVINLCGNAEHAMRGAVGLLEIDLNSVDIGATEARAKSVSGEGRYIVLTVRDTGTGMDEDTKKRIFEPFFTTKEVGEGTGLGLATAHGIVTASGGNITVDSAPGKGTTFRVYLPVADGTKRQATKVPEILAEN